MQASERSRARCIEFCTWFIDGREARTQNSKTVVFSESMTADFDRQVKAGRFYLNDRANVYRPTWKGTCLMTWKFLFPVSVILRWRIKAELGS